MEEHKSICRLCLGTCLESDSISVNDAELQLKFQIVFKFEFSDEECFPRSVCPLCSSKVVDYHFFHEMVRTNQAQLKILSDQVTQQSSSDDIKIEFSLDSFDHQSDISSKSYSPPVDRDSENFASTPDVKKEDELLNVRKRKRKRKVETNTTEAIEILENAEHTEEKARMLEDENRKIQEFFTLNCESCPESFDSFYRLQRHTRKIHNARGSIKCCNRVFYKKCKILAHINSHLNPRQFHCDICNKNYNDRYYLNLHQLRTHNNGKEKAFKCDKCAQAFHKKYLLKAHLSTHIQMECSICHKILASASTLRSHMINMHGEDTKLICDSCGQEFRTKLAMERHIKRHMGIDPIERVQCDICSKWVNGKPNLKIHIKTVHSEEKQTVSCDLCQQIYPNMRALSTHKRRVHVEERFECEFCGKKFKRKIYWKEHRASHTGQTLYSCDVCGMTTNSNANLYSHKKSKHPDEWMEARKKALAAAYGQSSGAGRDDVPV
ncbi:transcription factor grauzone-like [Topomyia yanbarensis]|uniref:transcription factor grauzone-like n=1 Tax=Topomyia yanbarensis TaxID=2498891 RepID=UPI00273B7B9F|nr:transcription factor grauzone-like [Topomyia yanbarensis]